MPFRIIHSDIAKVHADAIVNSANPNVFIGRGVDEAIYRAAGPGLLEARARIGPLKPGEAAFTPAFGLNAKYVIHTVGPDHRNPDERDEQDLRNCYRRSLQIARDLGCESIAFPLISTGTYRFPKPRAIEIAADAIREFLTVEDMDIILAVYDMKSFILSGRFARAQGDTLLEGHLAARMEDYFAEEGAPVLDDDLTVHWESRSEIQSDVKYSLRKPMQEDLQGSADAVAGGVLQAPRLYQAPMETADLRQETAAPDELWEDLDAKLDGGGLLAQTFTQRLLKLIDESGRSDPEVYQAANIDRRLFSKIRSNPAYQPSKATVLSLAVALQLNLDQTLDLLRSAGYTLSPAIPTDVIVRHFIKTGNHDIVDLNFYLFKVTQKTLV